MLPAKTFAICLFGLLGFAVAAPAESRALDDCVTDADCPGSQTCIKFWHNDLGRDVTICHT
ncbi:unnamed protein product [Clonostachys rosea]|uniref:Extracellular membrane protein CFEM domain-containing protein n=1 Tax=Bionectria ochroleuca TaxID=29856 RepID=A0ABY6UWA1_BIOOC|nr:unnamed protein product [Clonostachys rosea]